jgi:hypothetical protein
MDKASQALDLYRYQNRLGGGLLSRKGEVVMTSRKNRSDKPEKSYSRIGSLAKALQNSLARSGAKLKKWYHNSGARNYVPTVKMD